MPFSVYFLSVLFFLSSQCHLQQILLSAYQLLGKLTTNRCLNPMQICITMEANADLIPHTTGCSSLLTEFYIHSDNSICTGSDWSRTLGNDQRVSHLKSTFLKLFQSVMQKQVSIISELSFAILNTIGCSTRSAQASLEH